MEMVSGGVSSVTMGSGVLEGIGNESSLVISMVTCGGRGGDDCRAVNLGKGSSLDVGGREVRDGSTLAL